MGIHRIAADIIDSIPRRISATVTGLAEVTREAVRYDSGFGTVDYTCDSCQGKVKSMVLPPGWREEGSRRTCPRCGAAGLGGGAAGIGSGCALCGRPVPDIEDAIDEGWSPSFWVGQEERGPVCPSCTQTNLVQAPDGELVLESRMAAEIRAKGPAPHLEKRPAPHLRNHDDEFDEEFDGIERQ